MTTRNLIPTFPARLRTLRDRAGLTQADLAAKAGTSASAVSSIETGERAPSYELACRLADALDVSVEALRHGPDVPPWGPKRIPKKIN